MEHHDEMLDQELDLEQWARDNGNRRPPLCRRYRIRIDKKRFVVGDSAKYGHEILALVGYKPEEWNLDQKFRGGRREAVDPGQLVDFRTPGVERFETSPKQAQNGDSIPRRDFELPEEDAEYLDSQFSHWETHRDGSNQGVIIRSYPLPAGLAPSRADLMIRIPPQYPVTALDMFYLSPAVSRTDGRPIAQLTSHAFANHTWQRWSRHRVQGQQWRPGEDSLATHLRLVESALVRDSSKAA